MHLAERSGGGRMMLEACELALPVGAELGLHPPFDEGPAHRRRFALQLLQFGGVFRRQQIGDGRHQLGDLHQRTLEIAERGRERARLAGAVRLAAQKPAAAHSAPPRRRHWRRRGHSAPRGRRSGSFRDRPCSFVPRLRSVRVTLRFSQLHPLISPAPWERLHACETISARVSSPSRVWDYKGSA